ncbi:MAG: RNA ligase family protein, partial [Desulfobacterales bacterium]|nr:RNA ligase family protein [Desulfobacterales bacterium]
SFGPDRRLLLQSRGHYLTGGAREKHFSLFKRWAHSISAPLRRALGRRFVLYGEWLYAKHTVFYDLLPHYFMEFDVFDKENGLFLSTGRRRELLADVPLVPVRVLREGTFKTLKELTSLIGGSAFISEGHLTRLHESAVEKGLDGERVLRETDGSTDMEGLYVKVENNGVVEERYKYVRVEFLGAVERAEGHWLNRPIIPNRLKPGANMYGLST